MYLNEKGIMLQLTEIPHSCNERSEVASDEFYSFLIVDQIVCGYTIIAFLAITCEETDRCTHQA